MACVLICRKKNVISNEIAGFGTFEKTLNVIKPKINIGLFWASSFVPKFGIQLNIKWVCIKTNQIRGEFHALNFIAWTHLSS